MAEFPALPLWTDAYLGDTTHLNVTQHGAYLLLLITAWRSADRSLPDDNSRLARYARCTPQQWRALRPVLEEFFIIEDGKWRQRRLDDEYRAVWERRERAAENGRASALKRKGRHSTKRERGDNGAKAERQPSENLTIPIPNSEGKPSGAEGADPSEEFDPIKALFDEGVRILGEAGTPAKSARSIIGRWRAQFKDDDLVALALAAAESGHISQPLEWIPKYLAARKDRQPQQSGGGDSVLDSILDDPHYAGRAKAEAK